MSKDKKTSFRVSVDLVGKLQAISEELGHGSGNSIGIEFMEAMLELLNTPAAKRTTPKIIVMLDAIREIGKPLPGSSAPGSRVSDVNLAGEAVEARELIAAAEGEFGQRRSKRGLPPRAKHGSTP